MRKKLIRTSLVLSLLSAISWGSSSTGNSANTRILPDTGVTTSFTTTFGEDCDYTINPPAFTDNRDGTVTDTITGLIWQKADGGEMTWESAATYAKNLNLGGKSDWRLPDNHELFGLLNHSGNPALDSASFTMSAAEYWWTSDVMTGDTSRVWVANAGGGTGPHPKNETLSAGGAKRFHVRCVQGGVSGLPRHNFWDNGDGTVTDRDTGLIWQQGENTQTMTWEAALKYAENLTLAGSADWRLPNVKELQSLNDETMANPSIDRNFFPGAEGVKYWSSTTLAKQTPRAWYLDFQAGIVTYDDKTVALRVRCVRGGIASAVSADNVFLATELLGRLADTSITVNAVPARNMDVYFEYGASAGSYSSRTNTVSYAAGTPMEVTLSPLLADRLYHYRIRYREIGAAVFAAGEDHTFHTRRPTGSTFTVAIQADPHLDENTDPEAYRLTMQNMLGDNPDFMVDLGDTFMSDKIASPTFRQVLDRVLLLRSFHDLAGHSVPLFLTLGNHEGEWGSRLTTTADNLPVWDTVLRKSFYPNPVPDSFFSGSSEIAKYVGQRQAYYSWQWGNALFIVLDPYWNTPQSPESSGDWSLTLGRRQYDWLKTTLENSQAKFKFVFCHNLVGGWNKNGTGPMRGGVEAARYLEWGGYNLDDTWGFDKARPGWAMPVHQLLVKNNVTIFFHGHDHFYGKQDLDGLVYQEVPQPGAKNVDLGTRAASYGYTEGRLLGGTGYLRLRVSPSGVTVDYVQTWTPANQTASRKNGMTADSYTIAPTSPGSFDLELPAGGSGAVSTKGASPTLQTGYAATVIQSGEAPYGTAVFSYTQNGVVTSEAAVPASPPASSSRLFIDYGSRVAALPARLGTGTLSVNTGFAIVNPGIATANVTYTLRDLSGSTAAVGHGALDAGSHSAVFIDQLKALAPDFALTPQQLETLRYTTLQIDGDTPLSVVALRMTVNQRGSVLFTSLPVADLSQSPASSSLFLPQVADGGGYTTSLILLNTTGTRQTGSVRFFGNDGLALAVGTVDGKTGSSFDYSVPPGGCQVLQTDGSPLEAHTGSARIVPDAGTKAPVGAGVFSYTASSYLTTETGIASPLATAHARIFVDMTGGHDSGLAIEAIDASPVSVLLSAYQTDGITPAGSRSATLALSGNGHTSGFVREWIPGLPADFQGVLDISAASPFAALTLRSLTNARGDFLLTAFPVADLTRPAPAPLIFPHFADGAGYRTEFIFLSSGAASRLSVTLK